MIIKSTKSVVVLGADSPTGLGVARAIKEPGVKVIGVCTKKNHSCCISRIWDDLIEVEDNSESYLEILLHVGKQFYEKPFLIPSNDLNVLLISDHREKLFGYYEFVLPDKSTVNMLMDKTEFHVWAQERDFPVPESYVVGSRIELEEKLSYIEYPVVLKPFYRTKKWDQKNKYNKLYMINSKKEFEHIDFDLFELTPKYIIQRWIPGDDSDVYFCLFYYDRDGMEIAHYTGRKLIQWYVGTGNTAICVGYENFEVHNLASQIFRAASYKGLGSIEFKKNSSDGKYYITEPTVGRNNLQSYVAVKGNVNLAKMAFYDAIYKNQSKAATAKPAIFVVESYTIQALLYLFLKRKLQLKPLLDLMSGKGNLSFSLFKLNDPLPFFHYFIKKIILKSFPKILWMIRKIKQ